LPHWKWNDDLGFWEYGSAPDGDEDAITGMLLLVEVTASSKPVWWNEVAQWCYASILQFYYSTVIDEASEGVLKLGACWGGRDCNNPSYHAPGAWRAWRNWLQKRGTSLGKDQAEVTLYAGKYDKLIASSYKMLLADQNAADLPPIGMCRPPTLPIQVQLLVVDQVLLLISLVQKPLEVFGESRWITFGSLGNVPLRELIWTKL